MYSKTFHRNFVRLLENTFSLRVKTPHLVESELLTIFSPNSFFSERSFGSNWVVSGSKRTFPPSIRETKDKIFFVKS